MTKVAILLTNSLETSYGGIGPFVKNLDVHLSKYYDLSYFYLPEKFENCTIIPHRFLYFVYICSKYFTLKKYDFVISHSPEGSFVVSKLGIPYVHIFHGNDNPVSMSIFWYGKYFTSIFDFISKTISKNSLINYTVGNEMEGRKKILNPISHDFVLKENSVRSGFIFAGRLESGKRIGRLIDAYALLPFGIRMNNIFKIAGKGSQLDVLKAKIAELNLENQVILIGNLDNRSLIEQISSSKILLMASEFEGFPMAIAEALSVGVPVISTSVGDIPSFIRTGENGILLDKDYLDEDYKIGIETMLSDYDRFATNAYSTGKIFDAEKITDGLVSDLNKILNIQVK
ncbi:glycosyltransferase [Algoriphagus antarcticus]|uniref:Glycosyltransferase involved in cell wall biosynthesis n=1 Tax=Algoriphagus antarcticus TaxID=238540 RepID=A0A3E0DH59_9BACT|nr:glycosyltransferase [Algoriphagus antarcticus]REG81417.1 glycosyltransferase involved in cell wall biosynthesis [Algoriphagus antarcticus]